MKMTFIQENRELLERVSKGPISQMDVIRLQLRLSTATDRLEIALREATDRQIQVLNEPLFTGKPESKE